jgi:glutamyl-tRNA synthetase
MTVTRFAPSPTGKLHVGNLRPALLNWLFARKNGGQFVLRIDDTDAERSKEEYVDAIKRDLEWLGLDWDRYERQSERMDRYNAVADDLRGEERLYAAYETATELGLKRKTLLQSGRPPVYDRAALTLTQEDKAAFDAEGRKPHWRFKLDQERTGWTDGIRGDVTVDCASVSDPVLIREDGGFLYTLCSVCDDIDFGITDVIRGEDHVTNTATQIQIFDAMGDKPTGFAHHSLLVDADGSGLSKRLGSLTLESLREGGMDPLALLSYMARLGTSEPIEPRASHAELIDGFDLSTLGRAPARFNREEIDALAVKMLHTRPFEAVASLLQEAGVDADIAPQFWELIRENIESTEEISDWWRVVTGDVTPDIADEDREFVAIAGSALDAAKPWNETTWKSVTGALKAETGRKGKGLFMPLRKALTGRANGPDMAALLPLLRR